jgi:hypothetical protein
MRNVDVTMVQNVEEIDKCLSNHKEIFKRNEETVVERFKPVMTEEIQLFDCDQKFTDNLETDFII